jgi:hypothetical protein
MVSRPRTISSALARVGAALILAVSASAILTPAHADEPSFPQVCARHDLDVVTLIELQGQAQVVTPVKLAKAYDAVLEARRVCGEGRVTEAVSIYRNTFVDLREAAQNQAELDD